MTLHNVRNIQSGGVTGKRVPFIGIFPFKPRVISETCFKKGIVIMCYLFESIFLNSGLKVASEVIYGAARSIPCMREKPVIYPRRKGKRAKKFTKIAVAGSYILLMQTRTLQLVRRLF